MSPETAALAQLQHSLEVEQLHTQTLRQSLLGIQEELAKYQENLRLCEEELELCAREMRAWQRRYDALSVAADGCLDAAEAEAEANARAVCAAKSVLLQVVVLLGGADRGITTAGPAEARA